MISTAQGEGKPGAPKEGYRGMGTRERESREK